MNTKWLFFTGARYPVWPCTSSFGSLNARRSKKQELLSVSDPLVTLRLIECAVLIGFGRLTWLDSVASFYLDWSLITHYFLFAQAAKRIGPVFIQGLIVSLRAIAI